MRGVKCRKTSDDSLEDTKRWKGELVVGASACVSPPRNPLEVELRRANFTAQQRNTTHEHPPRTELCQISEDGHWTWTGQQRNRSPTPAHDPGSNTTFTVTYHHRLLSISLNILRTFSTPYRTVKIDSDIDSDEPNGIAFCH